MAVMDIRHVVVLMLENRSFDSMLGQLYQSGQDFDGLTGLESNLLHEPGQPPQRIPVWTDPSAAATALTIPDPDPGELFSDINMQIRGLTESGNPSSDPPNMSGFVDNYMRQTATNPKPDMFAVMHYFTPRHVPVISQLARAFAVSDRWHASAPCQTWPNRFFAHTGTAGGYVNNSPTHFPYRMRTVFELLAERRQTWKIYFHDIPQASTLAGLWLEVPTHFREFEPDFAHDAAAGTLPSYCFIEPRYFANPLRNRLPNDEHPPHNIAYGEQLIATVYNAIRGGPAWKQTLLVVTYDEHGGCYDHVVPPAATPPDDLHPDGFDFGTFGVRVPAVIVSPHVRAGSVIRPPGTTPFDHTSIIATLRELFGIGRLTRRDAAAPGLLRALDDRVSNDGPASITAPAVPPTREQVARAGFRPLNDLQKSLVTAAVHLPTLGADIPAHVQRLAAATDLAPVHASVGDAVADIEAHVKAFLGKV
jgi:phospholipase C